MSNIKDYAVQLVNIQPDDVILLHVAEDLDLDTVHSIYREIEKAFPNNTILVSNENILKRISIFRTDTPMLVANTINNELNLLDNTISTDFTGGYVGTYKGSEIYDVLY